MSLAAGGAVALAAALDRLLAEPRARVHPVAWLGRTISVVDDRLPDARGTGVVLAVVVPIGFGVSISVPILLVGERFGSGVPPLEHVAVGWGSALAAAVLAGVALFVCSSHRMLIEEAEAVISLSRTDLPGARTRLRSLAGRDATELTPARIRSAAVESAAENLADGLIAPYLAFAGGTVLAAALGSSTHVALAFGTAAAGWVKGVNTLDSMLGYRDRATGWAPARLDDVVMWAPARMAALLLALAGGPTHAPDVLGRASGAANAPSSPNSGWPMATVASIGRIRLEKPNAYTLFPEHALPTAADANASVRLVSRAGWIGTAGAALTVVALA